MFTEPAMVKIVCLTNLKYIRTTLFNKCIETFAQECTTKMEIF